MKAIDLQQYTKFQELLTRYNFIIEQMYNDSFHLIWKDDPVVRIYCTDTEQATYWIYGFMRAKEWHESFYKRT